MFTPLFLLSGASSSSRLCPQSSPGPTTILLTVHLSKVDIVNSLHIANIAFYSLRSNLRYDIYGGSYSSPEYSSKSFLHSLCYRTGFHIHHPATGRRRTWPPTSRRREARPRAAVARRVRGRRVARQVRELRRQRLRQTQLLLALCRPGAGC